MVNIKLNNNLIIQYGRRNNIVNWGGTQYPIAFTICVSLTGSPLYNGNNITTPAIFSNITLVSFDGWFVSNQKADLRWIAIGY